MSTLERRVQKLEAQAGFGIEPLFVIIRSFAPGPLVGFSTPDQLIRRREGESEAALEERALAALPKGAAFVSMREIRGTA
jgi:hypothetical protein